MSDDLKPGVISSILEPILTHPKTQMAISTGTTAIAIDMGSTQYLQSVMAAVGVTLGTILTTVLIIRNVLLMNDERAERKRKAQERNEATL